ncbi:putative survival motor neuron-like protein 1 protein [Botrytis fragariae]|uniref:Putative survival motor neuron-like protein 1 protein n=1 Tax=Botrytis fragariae TaxID=1964551 RepID=A0A8H6ALV6_9HELO|nr:putative survival motor neuron-like protein 1 protein [Botrytis fragariae]KAF5869862.1 putative survival motor neuron-like protein 1 protein [Botrytis fragariae]
MASQNNVSHAELWDDSTLVDSWNEALQEYEKYHSIHARGEKVEDVLNAFENQSNGLQVCLLPTIMILLTFCREGEINENNGEGVEELLEENIVMQSEFEQTNEQTQAGPKVGDKPAPKAAMSGSSSSKAPTLPPQLIGQVHDENLKNLLMSWYYAGYYTGLYEGQQQKQEPSKGT